jgi:hypothetical protein
MLNLSKHPAVRSRIEGWGKRQAVKIWKRLTSCRGHSASDAASLGIRPLVEHTAIAATPEDVPGHLGTDSVGHTYRTS